MAHRKIRKNLYDALPVPQLPGLGNVPVASHTLSILFRLSGPRTWVFPAVSFILGYTIAGGGELPQIGLGLAIACLLTAATNVLNAYADRKEDVVNQPHRLFWLDQIGSRETIASVIMFYGIAVSLSIYLGFLFMLVLSIGILNSIFYSAPPIRFKARPFASLLSFSGALGLPFLAGLSVRGSLDLLNPMLWLLVCFMFAYGTVKNLPDYLGDKKAGIRTSATIFKDVKSAVLFSSLLLFTPYFLLVILIGLGLLGPVFLADLALAPGLAFIASKMWKAKGPKELEKTHTLGFFYAISFLLLTLVVASPTIQSLVILLAVYLWTLTVAKVQVHSRVEDREWERPGRKKN